MPSSSAEESIPRGLRWVAVIGNAAMTLVLMGLIPVAIRDRIEAPQLLVYVLFVAACAVGVGYFAVLVVVRPRLSVEEIRAASAGDARRVVLPGSARTAVWATATAGLWAAVASLGTMIVSPGWAIVCVVVAALLAVATVDQGFAGRARRYLIITPDGVESGSFGGSARVGWDDIGFISLRQGLGGHIVIRIDPRAGAASWAQLTRHPLHRAKRRMDVEPLALDVDPVLLGVFLLTAWEEPWVREGISGVALSAQLVDPDWLLTRPLPPAATILLKRYRPERAPH